MMKEFLINFMSKFPSKKFILYTRADLETNLPNVTVNKV